MIRIMVILSIFFLAFDCYAENVFNDYEIFYKTLPNRLFLKPSSPLPSLDTLGNVPDLQTRDWIIAEENLVKIHGQEFNLLKAISLLNEPISYEDVGRHPDLYTQERYFCIQGQGATSGSGSRYISVYLIDRKSKKIFKFPSLFSSCFTLGKDKNQHITFFDAKIISYRAINDADGVKFQEYVLKGEKVSKTSKKIRVKFPNNENFYRFIIEK